ncbi:LysR substrate-binding domain-containing protein [Agrobacterium vitis]|uniref:LysR substrate-binding domain-containing protein n=1 Tax=Agrobacterium vitis TaxID=373 RepID=UPI0012E89536|nr:LysR substrate-binding domain-containing protein [Agrobacterium vitis]MUZ66131.1 LysR family transcriptional regulator [Agrobacterium vitis]
MSNMNLNDISRLDFNLAITFLAVWQERSVSRAALKLSLSQSAVSAALSRLRRVANDPLFIRTHGGMEPTSRAVAMAGQIQQGIESIRQALTVEEAFDPKASNRHFSVGMSDDFEVAIGPALSAYLLKVAPNVSIVFRQTNRHIVESMLEARDIDIALSSGVPARNWLISKTVATSGYSTIFNNALCQVELPLSLDDFLALPHILISFSGREGIVDAGLKSIGRQRQIHTALTHFSSLPNYLATMRAVATLPSHTAAAFAKLGGLSLSDVPVDLGTYPVDILYRRDVEQDPAIRWLVDVIGDIFSERQ